MKRKIICIFLCTMAAMSLISCGSSNTSTNVEENNSIKIEQDENETIKDEIVSTYEMENETELYDADNWPEIFNGNIEDLVINSGTVYIITQNGTIYENSSELAGYEFVEYSKLISTGVDGATFAHGKMEQGTLIIDHQNGSYSAYDLSNIERNLTFECKNLACGYFSTSDFLTLHFDDNGNLMQNLYQESNNWECTTLPVIVKEQKAFDSEEEQLYSGSFKYSYAFGNDSLFVIREDDVGYFIDLWNFGKRTDGYATYVTLSKYGNYDNVSSLVPDITSVYWTRYDSDKLQVAKGTRRDEYSELDLPEGYTGQNVEQIHNPPYDIVLIMDDGNIFWYDWYDDDPKWILLEYVSTLYQENHIIEFIESIESYSGLYMLCDDNNLYEIEPSSY